MRSRLGQGKARYPQQWCKARLSCMIISLALIAATGIAQAQDGRIIKIEMPNSIRLIPASNYSCASMRSCARFSKCRRDAPCLK
jgi:hypothetical protein